MAITIFICLLLYFSKENRKLAKLIFLTNLISFPTLLLIGTILTALFALPGLGLMYLLYYLDLIPLIGISLLLFVVLVAFTALYHWRIGYVIIKNYVNDIHFYSGISDNIVYLLGLGRIVNQILLRVMKKRNKIDVSKYYFDEKDNSLNGVLPANEIFTYLGAKLKSRKSNKVHGYVIESFTVWSLDSVKDRAKGIEFEINDRYGKIALEQFAIELIKSNDSNEFYLEELLPHYQKDKKQIKNSKDLVKLRRISGRYFSNFYLDVRGGETGSSGRSEHGQPHFHIISYTGQKDLGKGFFPSVDDRLKNQTSIRFESSLKKRDLDKISDWIFKDDLNNLKSLNNEWIERNKFNNRTKK
ncbi:hypothetical protein [Acidiluteibacter ferrifornacis]|nr:hypothetical protein [Acidiluteibacter ferrifornacis]